MDDALGDQPRHLGRGADRQLAPRRAGTVPAERAGWTHAVALAELVGRGRRARRSSAGPRTSPPGTPGAAPRSCCAGRTSSSGHAGELHPRSCAAFGLPPRTQRARARPRRADRRGARRRRRSRRCRPTRWPRRTSPWSSTRPCPAAEVAAALRRRRGALLESVAAVRRLHRAADRRGPEVPGLRPALPGARTGRSPTPRRRPPGTPPWPRRRAGHRGGAAHAE